MFSKNFLTRCLQCIAVGVVTLSLVACGGGYASWPMPLPISGPVLDTLTRTATIGSTLDPIEHGGNPYGLALAFTTSGPVSAGDLIVCNFNDGASNSEGRGTTLVGLHPGLGAATPYRIAQSDQLLGCSSVATLPNGGIIVTASQANAVVLVSPNGSISTPFSADTFATPWSAITGCYLGQWLLFVSNAGDGSIDRITLAWDPQTMQITQTGFTEIAQGFSLNDGMPGAIAAPAGLTYDGSIDTLYVVDTNANRVVALAGASALGSDAVVVSGAGFSGVSAASARVVAAGAPLNGPISGALLINGNIVVGNTLDADGTNLLVEVSPTTGVVATKNVDSGAGGAIFGIVAVPVLVSVATPGTGDSMVAISDRILYNNDNANAVVALSPSH